MTLGRVLIVDDEPDHRTIFAALVERGGDGTYAVEAAGSLAEAVSLAAEHPFDVALVDLRLPDGDGIACMHALRQLQPNLRVVILTAYPTPASCSVALREGAAAYLEKSFGPEHLRSLLGALMPGGDGADGAE